MAKVNMGAIIDLWAPTIEKITKGAVNRKDNEEKMSWMCEMAHNERMRTMQSVNEAALGEVGGVSFPFQNLYNTMGVGNAVPASMAGTSAAEQTSPAVKGSGDKWPSLLPMQLQVAGRTIAFDLVHTTPFSGPTGVIPFLDYVYSNGKDIFGASPAYDSSTANPEYSVGGEAADKSYLKQSNPSCFRVKFDGNIDPSLNRKMIAKGLYDKDVFELGSGTDIVKVQFIGMTRLTAEPMFKVIPYEGNCSIAKLFEQGASQEIKINVTIGGSSVEKKIYVAAPRLISMLEDQIQGYVGAGKYDNDRWTGTFQNPFKLYEPMDRATGEQQYPRQLSLKVHTQFVEVGTTSIAVGVTQEQVQDLQKQWGIDVLKMVENAAINELSQSINKHILSRLFAMGWYNHMKAYEAEGINLNLSLTEDEGLATPSFAYYEAGKELNGSMPLPKYHNYGDFENLDTKFSRVLKLVKTAGNVIMHRGRRGTATFVVCNTTVASMLQDAAQYTFSPIANTFNQNNGQLYPLGTLAGMTVYVDPLMRLDDTRILVGRKGEKDEPGVHFCPYIMAESVRMIAEGTASPKVVVKTRYNLVDVGWYPFTNYITLFVNIPEDNLY